jgi:hypothetical protein
MMKKMQVDRFEEQLAVLADDDMKILNIPKEFFPFEIHEGDIFEIEFDGDVPVAARFLAEETETAKARTRALLNKIRSKKKNI